MSCTVDAKSQEGHHKNVQISSREPLIRNHFASSQIGKSLNECRAGNSVRLIRNGNDVYVPKSPLGQLLPSFQKVALSSTHQYENANRMLVIRKFLGGFSVFLFAEFAGKPGKPRSIATERARICPQRGDLVSCSGIRGQVLRQVWLHGDASPYATQVAEPLTVLIRRLAAALICA